ncbi:titin-like isoform X5 [Cherax quadricarinatus]
MVQAYEEFVDECERARRDLETLQVELRREEPCSRASTLHDLLSVNTNTYNTITARPAVIFNIGQEVLKVLEMDEESGFRVCEGQGDSAEAASRVRAMLHDLHLLTTAVEACWRRLNTALDTYMQVRELESDMNDIGQWLVSAGQTLLAETSIGTTTDQAEALLREHEAIELKCRETYGRWAGLRYKVEDALDRGDGDLRALADHRTTTTDLRSLKDYTDTLVRTFASRLDRRRTLILASVRFHRIAHQMGERCSVLLQQHRWLPHTHHVDTLKKTLRELTSRKEAIDYLASEGTRAGEKLLDLLTVGVKDLSGRDITPDYTAELNHVHALLTAQHEHYARAARQADLHKLRLQQNIQLLTCQRDVKQAHKWLKALLEALVKAHAHVGRSSEEIRRLKTEHQQFQETASGTFEYGYESARAALLVEKSAGGSVLCESRSMVGDLENVWKMFVQGSQEQLTRLRVAGVFFRTMEQHLERLDSLCTSAMEKMSSRGPTADTEARNLFTSRDRLLREIGRNVRLGKLLKERLSDPLVPNFSVREHNENLLAQESISERIQHITNRAQQLDALMFPSAVAATPTPTVHDTQARPDADHEGSGSTGSTEYWTCSECRSTSSGSYHTCPECQQLRDLFTHDDTRPPSEADLPLDEILRRSRSRTKSGSKGKDDPAKAGAKHRSRSRSRSRSIPRVLDDEETKVTTAKRGAPRDHPDAIERATRSRSRSRSKSLTREIVASFKEFRDKVTRGRSRSKSRERKKIEEDEAATAKVGSTEDNRLEGMANGDIRIPVQVQPQISHPPGKPEKAWKEVSSETVRTRVILHGGDTQGDRTLTLEQITSVRKPEDIQDSQTLRNAFRWKSPPSAADSSSPRTSTWAQPKAAVTDICDRAFTSPESSQLAHTPVSLLPVHSPVSTASRHATPLVQTSPFGLPSSTSTSAVAVFPQEANEDASVPQISQVFPPVVESGMRECVISPSEEVWPPPPLGLPSSSSTTTVAVLPQEANEYASVPQISQVSLPAVEHCVCDGVSNPSEETWPPPPDLPPPEEPTLIQVRPTGSISLANVDSEPVPPSHSHVLASETKTLPPSCPAVEEDLPPPRPPTPDLEVDDAPPPRPPEPTDVYEDCVLTNMPSAHNAPPCPLPPSSYEVVPPRPAPPVLDNLAEDLLECAPPRPDPPSDDADDERETTPPRPRPPVEYEIVIPPRPPLPTIHEYSPIREGSPVLEELPENTKNGVIPSWQKTSIIKKFTPPRPTEADMETPPSPLLPPPPEESELQAKLVPTEAAPENSSPSDHPYTSSSPEKSGTSPEKESDGDTGTASLKDPRSVTDESSQQPLGLPPVFPHTKEGEDEIIRKMRKSAEWLELRVVELTPGMVYLGANLEEATQLLHAHEDVLTKLQNKQSPVEDLLNQADQLISTQHPRAEVYASMAESLGLAWKDLNSQLETRKQILDMGVAFHRRAQQYSDSMDAAERAYTDNVMPNDAEGARQLLSSLHDHKRAVLEASMYTLQEAQALLARLRGLSSEGATLDSRPLHIKTNIEFACSQIEHYLESLHDRRRFLDGLFSARKHHLEQCLALCILYQDLTEAVTALKQLRDEVSQHQGLGESQSNAEILYHDHIKREVAAKEQQDRCIRLLKTAENMASGGHYAGVEARSRAYSVLEAATALHETCDTRTALLQQAILFFRLAQTALTKLDQAEVQVAGLGREGPQRLSLVLGVVEEAVQPALTEGYAILEVTGGRNQPHNMGISLVVEELERRRSNLSSICVSSTEQVLQRTELSNAFLEQYNTIESWLVRIGDAFLQGHQDPGGSLSLAKDFLHLHQTLSHDVMEKKNEIDALSTFLDKLLPDLSAEEGTGYQEKMQALQEHWAMLKKLLDVRIIISEKYVKFHEDAEAVNNAHEALELLLKEAQGEDRGAEVEAMWEQVQKLYLDLCNTGKAFCQDVRSAEDPYLDSNRAVLCVESILEHLGKRRLVITDLHSHFHMKITATKEMMVLWKTYRENVSKMQSEMSQMETDFCPLLRGNTADPEGMANTLEQRLNIYVSAVKKTQEDIQNMMTRAEVMSYKGDDGGQRDEVIGSLLQLYQNLQNKATEYQILGHMLIQWCRNIAEIHRSCDKLESQFSSVSLDIGGVEGQLREHEASKQAVLELMKFAQNEADSIISKIKDQCPPEAGAQDVAVIEEMLKRRGREFETVWLQHQYMLERQLKRSQYHVDLQVISDQLRDLSEQLSRMRGHYGDSLAAATNMQTAFNQFLITVDMLENRIQTFVSTTIKMLGPEDDSGEVQEDLAELEKKWSTFQMQVGQSKKSIELSIVFYKLVEEAEDWVKQGSKILVDVAGESANIQNPEEAEKLRSRIEHFLKPGEEAQQERLTQISSLAVELYDGQSPKQVEVVNYQNAQMLNSFTVINRNFIMMVENLRAAEEHREKQKREKEELAASLAAAQAEAEAARLAAIAAEEARKAAEEVAKTLVIPVEPIVPQRVEIEIQTEAIPLSDDEEPYKQEDTPPFKKAKLIDDEPQPMPPIFLTPLVGATVTEGVKFSFECKVLGMPMPEVEWLKDNMSITTNPDYKTSFEEGICTLTIEETFTEDSALFTCRAVNAAGIAETSATLIVKEAEPVEVLSPPLFTKRLIDSTAQEGSTFQLEATVQGHPLPVVSWAKDANCIDESPDYVITYNNGECVLRFEEVFLEDKAEYSCKATNDLGEDITKAKLSVIAVEVSERPKFTMPLSNVMARAGQKFKLECHVTGLPSPTVTWFHNTKPVKETPDCRITFDGSIATLVMSEAFPKNAGTYTVVAKNSAGEGQCSANVSVKGRIPTETSDSEVTSDIDVEPVKPTVQLPLKDTTVKEGKSARLDCVIIGQPEPEVIWYHDDKPVKESNDFKLLFHGDRCSLIIQEAFLEDAGIYRVVAMNSAGEASTACFLNVDPIPEPTPPPAPEPPAVAPRFSQLLVDNHVTEGNPVTLRATVTGQPKPTISWFRESMPLIPDNELQIHESSDGSVSATIHAATLDHTGQYEIVASNTAGTAKCVAYLSIEPRLPTPPPTEHTEPPVFTKLITDTTVLSGGSVKFEAEVQGLPMPTVHWTLNDCPITGQEYLRGHLQYVLGSSGNMHSLELPTTSVMQAGRVAVIAENSVGKAVSAATLNIVGALADSRRGRQARSTLHEPAGSEVEPAMPAVHQTTREESHVSSSTSSTTVFQKSTVMESSHFTKVVSDGTTDEKRHSMAATSTSHVQKATGQPTVEVHGAHLQEMRQEGTAPPVICDKVSLVKREGEIVTQQISQDTSTAAFSPPAKKILISKKKSMPARFVAPLQGVITKEGSQVTLECIIDGFPDPSVTWTHNGGPLSEDAQVKTHLNKTAVIIPRVNQSHSGHYTCLIENETGSAQCTCDVIVKKTQFPPVISKRLQPAVVGVNERLHLEIDVTGTPSPDVSWTKDGQPIRASDHIALKSEGTRHLLVIQLAEPGDSGRYGVIASNPAGRAESLADVMVTQLILDKAPPTHRMMFTDVTDEAKRNIESVEEGHVKTIKRAIEEVAVEAPPSSSPAKILKAPVPKPSFELPTTPQAPPIPVNVPQAPLEPMREEELEVKRLPGKLKKAWPPPPLSDDEADHIPKIDTSVEITSHNVSSIISSFSATSEMQSSYISHTAVPKQPSKPKPQPKLPDELNIELEPEPAPEYGFIPPSEPMVIEEPEPELQQEITPASQPDEGYTPLLDPMLVTEPEPDLQHKIIPTSQPDAYYMPPSEPMLVPEPEPEYLVAQLPEPVHVPEPHIESLQTYKSHKIKDVMVAEHFESGSQLRQEYKRVSAPIVETYKILSPVPEVVPEPVPTPEPCKAIAQEQFKAATPEPPRVPSPEPPKVPTPEPPRVPTPEPPRVPTPEPPRVPTPEPPKVPTPEPPRVSTPEPPRIPTPEPPRIPTPEPPRLPSPEPPKVPTPEPPRVPTPEPPKVPTPEPPKVPTPEPPRVPTPEPPKVPTPEPPRVPTPEPPKVPTPEPPKVSTPEPPKVPTPEPPKAPTPEPPKVPTPEPPKVPTPEPLRVPTPEPPKVPSTVTVVEQITKESYQEPKIEKEVKMETSSVETSFYESKKSLSKTSYSTVETKVYTTGLSSPPVEQVVNAQDVILHPSPLEPSFEISGAQDLIISESAVESLPVQAPDAVVVDKKLPSEDDLLEYFVPESEQVIEFIPTPEPVPREPSPEPESSISEQAFSSRPEVGYISDMKHEKFPSDVSASLISSSVGREMQTMFVSSSNVQTKVFSPLPPQETVEPTTLESQKPERQPLQPLIMPDYHHPEQENIEESIKPPKRPERDEVKEQRKPKKKRESVIQLAKRLEESIPMSPDEVPGGVRMFPSPKQPSTPVRDVPTPTRETLSAEDKMFADLKGEKFPELEPFPFTVEERPRKERPRSLPPPMPRKFIPGSFTDSEYESDMETEHRIQLKKIKFEVQEPTPRPASAGAGQEILPPSAFDTPPVFEGGMRPEILKKEEVVKKEPKSITPKKKTKIVEKFLATAGKSTEQEIAKPVPKKLTKKDTKPPKAVETIEKLPQLIVEEKHVGKPSPIVPEQIDIEFAGVKSPGKLVKSWPPQPDSQLTKSLKMDRSFVTQQQTSSVSSFSETKTHKSSVSYETKESKVVNYSHHTSIPVSAVVPECAPEPAHQAEPIPEYILQPEPAPEYIQPEPTPQYIQPEPAPEYIQPEPAPVYVQPEPAPEYIQPEPAPEYSVQLEPAPVYVHPEPAPVYVRPEPAPVYVQPEPTPEYILQPEPAPEYIVQPEPAPEFIVQPEPVPEYILQPEPVQEYAAQPKPATVSAPEPLVEVVPAPGFRSVRAPTSKTTKIKSSPAPPPPFDMTPPELSAVSKSVKSEAKTTIVTKTAHESVVTQDKKTVSKPTVQTMTKPMVKPVTKPKVKPVTEPTVKPVTKPTVKPVTEPTIIPLQKPEPPSQSVSRPLWISKKVGAWPPSSHDETPNAIPTLKTRSQSAERPRVTESATLPARPHEAPPAIYWSSNVTLQEKRMLGLQVVPQVETVTSTTVQESSSMTSRQMKKMSQTSTKQIKTDMTVQQRKPTPVSVQSSVPSFKKPNIQPKKEVFVKSSAPSREISVVSPLIQLPPLEPFPFSVELEKEKKPRGKAPSMPKKFYPGSFTESEYESDYDSKSGSYSRLYMSDSEAVGYRPMNIKMKKGRTKKPKQPSPPPPSTFGPPPPFETRLLPLSLCFSDVESDIPTSRESTPVPRTVISQSKHIIHSAKSLASQITPENKPVKQQERFIQKKAPIITPAPAPNVTPLSPTKPSPAVASKVPTVTSKPATVTISKTVKEPPGTQMTKSVSSVTSAKNIHTNVQHVTSEKHVQITEKQERGVKSMKKMFEGSGPVPVPQGIITSPHVPVPSVVGIKPLVSSTGVKPVQIPTTAPSTAQVSQPSEASVRYIPVACETNGTEKVTSSNNIKAKPSSPKSRKKMENTQITAQELEESGYAADTEGTLPRRSTKTSQSMNSSNFSSSFSKSESFMSSSFSKSESKSFTSSEFGKVEPPSFASGFGIPASDGFPPEGGFPSGSFSFPSTPASSVGQTSHFSSSFKSSESKSSQMFTSRSEEIREERRGGEGPKTTKAAAPPPPQQSEKKPKQKYEEYRKETRGKPGTSSPFSEDTYYAMKDESDVSTGSSRTQKKVEFKSETHVEIMSDKKVEVFESTSVDVSPQPSRKQAVKVEQKIDKKTIEPKIEKSKEVSKSFKQFKEIKRPESQDLKKSETTVKRGEHVTHMQVTKSGVLTKPVEKCKTDGKLIESVQVDSELKVKQIKKSQHEKVTKVPEIHPLKSTGLVKQAVTQQVKEKEELDLKPFPFKVEPEKPKKPRGAVPPQPTKFVKGEFHESDYESDYEGRIPPKWKPSDSDAEDQGYRKIKVSVGTPKVSQPRIRTPTPPTVFDEPPQFEGPPRPKVDFPESETEYEREISPEIIIPEKVEILIHPEPPLVVPKEPKIFKSQLQKKVAPPKRSPSPVLKPGSPPVEDYVPPQAAKSASFSNAIGVESTKITKLADSSKHHQRFLTMQQTTRVIKFTDARSTTTTEAQESRSKPLFKEEPKQKPLPVLEPFPFSPEPERPKRERGAPPPKPKKFQKGEFTESDYESDYEGHIKPKWQPSDSDVEISYNKVKPCLQSDRTPSKTRERTPTPPTVFDSPPESGGPWRPIIEPPEPVTQKEPSSEVLITKELPKKIEPPKKITVKIPAKVEYVERSVSPPLPSPGPTPEEGIIVQETQYVVDKVDLKSRVIAPPMKEIQTYKVKPYTKITERTEKTITNLKLEEELRIKKEKKETKKTIITESEQVPTQFPPPAKSEQLTIETEKFQDLEPFPFEPDKDKPKRQRGPPPPKPKKFIKGEFRESDYDSDYEGRVRPKWKPPDSDVEDPEYTPVRPPPPTERHSSKSKERTPTPPSKFEVPPASGGPLRPTVDPVDKHVVFVKEPSPEIIIPKVKAQPISKISKITPKAPVLKPKEPEPQIPKIPSPPLPEPGPQPLIGYVQVKAPPKTEEKDDVHIKMIKKKVEAKKGFQIDIDITDIYDFVSESDHERREIEHSQTKPLPKLVPFPYEPDPGRPKRQRGPPPPQPKKFMKGEFRGSDYESDYETPIAPKWAPPDSEGEEHFYRRVAPPVGEIGKQRSESSGRDPSPPSKFDQPPHFEGPPRPVLELSDLPRRERRESLEEYSIPRFPMVEFKPFDLEDDVIVHPQGAITTDTETETESHTKEGIDRRYVKSTQKVVSHQFEDMTQTFRHKAQKFAEQLVTEVFAAREGSVPAEPAGEPPSLPEELRTRSVSPDSTAMPPSTTAAYEALSPSTQEPQAYRDESRISEFGTKHIDPETGLIYFKYDFGYEFGVILPGEAKKVDKTKQLNGDHSNDIPIPVIHEKTDAFAKTGKDIAKTNGHVPHLETTGPQNAPAILIEDAASRKGSSTQTPRTDHVSPQPSLQSDISETDPTTRSGSSVRRGTAPRMRSAGGPTRTGDMVQRGQHPPEWTRLPDSLQKRCL